MASVFLLCVFGFEELYASPFDAYARLFSLICSLFDYFVPLKIKMQTYKGFGVWVLLDIGLYPMLMYIDHACVALWQAGFQGFFI